MRRGLRRATVFLCGLLFIGLSAAIYIRFLQHYRTTLTVMETLRPVRLLQAGETVRAESIRRVQIPIAAHTAEAAVQVSEVVGKTALVPIGPEEEFARWKLVDSVITPREGERYYSFRTDKLQNNANLVRRGDRVDVWVEFDAPKWLRETNGVRRQVASVKLIEELLVAGVKTAEGAEVTEAGGLDQLLAAVRGGSAADMARGNVLQARMQPNGVPEINTYIMREDVYNAYALGSLGGRIKLALSDWNRLPAAPDGAEAKLTEMFRQLQGSDIFNKESKHTEVTVERIVGDQVAGNE